ncbi:MAG: hypothetical protein NZM04_01055 [Methylacidiphilales bacterium]|nr:hypothetical protein [Candidatus Methylacidiphilales bacterium]
MKKQLIIVKICISLLWIGELIAEDYIDNPLSPQDIDKIDKVLIDSGMGNECIMSEIYDDFKLNFIKNTYLKVPKLEKIKKRKLVGASFTIYFLDKENNLIANGIYGCLSEKEHYVLILRREFIHQLNQPYLKLEFPNVKNNVIPYGRWRDDIDYNMYQLSMGFADRILGFSPGF